jgi:hypothetical protein
MYTLYFYNSGGEREQHGAHESLEAALAEKADLQEELGDAEDEQFEIVVQFI